MIILPFLFALWFVVLPPVLLVLAVYGIVKGFREGLAIRRQERSDRLLAEESKT